MRKIGGACARPFNLLIEMNDKNGVHVDTPVHPATGELLTGYDD
jgi:hypothetical protein